MLKRVKLNSLKNNEIKAKSYNITQPTAQGCLKKHFRLSVIAGSGSGKTTAVLNFLNQCGYMSKEIFQTIYLVSPTAKDPVTGLRSERKFEIGNRKHGFADYEYSTLTNNVLNEIIEKQQQMILDHIEYLEDKELYKRIIQDPDLIDPFVMIRFMNKYNMEPPKSPTGFETFPCMLVIFDDITSSAQLKSLSDFFSKSRHILASCIVINQHYAQQSYALRKQMSAVWLFKNKDEKLLRTLYDQNVSGDMDWETWQKMNKTLEKKHDFLFIDNSADDNFKYRKNFDEYFTDWQK